MTDELDLAHDPFGSKRCRRSLIGAEQQRSDPVDLDPRVLLGHREVA
jgi:hypothetical protein